MEKDYGTQRIIRLWNTYYYRFDYWRKHVITKLRRNKNLETYFTNRVSFLIAPSLYAISVSKLIRRSKSYVFRIQIQIERSWFSRLRCWFRYLDGAWARTRSFKVALCFFFFFVTNPAAWETRIHICIFYEYYHVSHLSDRSSLRLNLADKKGALRFKSFPLFFFFFSGRSIW